jgi:hypothetical protein
MRTVLLLGLLLVLAGCADPYRAMYEGIMNRNEAKRTPNERALKPTPSYDEYKKERERLEQTR